MSLVCQLVPGQRFRFGVDEWGCGGVVASCSGSTGYNDADMSIQHQLRTIQAILEFAQETKRGNPLLVHLWSVNMWEQSRGNTILEFKRWLNIVTAHLASINSRGCSDLDCFFILSK